MTKLSLKFIPIIIFLGLCIFLWRGLSLDPHHIPLAQLNKPLPVFAVSQLQNPDNSFNSNALLHQVSLLNVWASWCQACVDEQVFMLQLAREGVKIYGLNYKDNRDDAMAWLKQWGNPFQLIGQDPDGTIGIDLGVYGAPETFVIDKKGIIRYRHVGVMNEEVWEKEIHPLMKQLEQVG